MLKTKEAQKIIKPTNKVGLITTSLKKNNSSTLNTGRPKFVQKLITEENR